MSPEAQILTFPAPLDPVDRTILLATQDGLELTQRPYDALAKRLGLSAGDVMARMQRMFERGMMRRNGATPDPRALGNVVSAISVWDVPDALIRETGTAVATLPQVSHCYHRPRQPPKWRYNLYAVVHGRSRREIERYVDQIARLLGDTARGFEVIYSTKTLKQTGFRLPS